LHKASAAAPPAESPRVATGFPVLDQALGIGGIPRGRVTELLGIPTAGMATLALRITAHAQANGDQAAWIDVDYTFDPHYAARCGVELGRLLLVRPHSGREALEITRDLVASGGVGVLVFESVSRLLGEAHGAQAMSGVLRRLTGPLAGSPCALIFLTPLYFGNAASKHNYPGGFALPHYAAVRLLIERERWLRRHRDIRGCQARVSVLKNKLGPAGQQVTIAITFNGVRRGNGA